MISRALVAEAAGTAGLLAVVVGSGIMGERLANGNPAIALLANSAATAGGLYALIVTLGPVSGAHFNPLVTLAAALSRELGWKTAALYVLVQAPAAVAGAWLAHAMFAMPILQTSSRVREGPGQWLGEFVATFGLIACIRLCSRGVPDRTAGVVAAYIGAAYWFTSSTSFANPAVTLARSLTDTFAGIAPANVAAFVSAQVAGAIAGYVFVRFLRP